MSRNKRVFSMTRRLLIVGLVVFLGVVIIYFELIRYGLAQGYGQFQILWNARPIAEVLEDSLVNSEIKEKLQLVQSVREFAQSELGLKDTRNYTTFYDQKGKPILWLVRAAYPYQLRNVEWTFPVVGTVSYKGYFELNKALELRDELRSRGFDTYVREVSAWSTLGWFRDPILSGMLDGPEGDIASTIIHELTHATIFVKDSLAFNENLASFIGEIGANEYLVFKYGIESSQYDGYQKVKRDRTLFANHFVRGAAYLDSLYTSFGSDKDTLAMEAQKQVSISKIVASMDTIVFSNKNYARRFAEDRPNNAFFMSYLLYRGEQQKLDSLLMNDFHGDLRLLISKLKEIHGNR